MEAYAADYIGFLGKAKTERLAYRESVALLEKNGFKCKEDGPEGRENTVGSRFPISIDVDRKLYGHVGSTLCAAAASSSVLISAEDFIAVFEVMSSLVIV